MKKMLFVLLIIFVAFIIDLKFFYHNEMPIQNTEHNEIIQKSISPNGNKIAISFTRNFGATTDFNSQVSILSKNDNFYDKPGNTFIANHNKIINMKWQDNDTLIISYSCDENNIFLKEYNIKDVKVTYNCVSLKI